MRSELDAIRKAVGILRSGGLVAFPTETVYGLGADATNADAIQQIFVAKGRPVTNPLIVHIADAVRARRYAAIWPDDAERLARAFWPGPLTIVLPKHSSIVDSATAGRQTVGLRAPDHPLTHKLLREFDGPLAGPSANRSNHISPTTAAHVQQELGDRVDLILDGGPCSVGIESTVIDLSADVPTILRPGGVSRQQIVAVIGEVGVFTGHVASTTAAMSPGQHQVHYAPSTPAYRFETFQRQQIQPAAGNGQANGIMALGDSFRHCNSSSILEMPHDPAQYAQHLYRILHGLDGMHLAAIYVEMPPDEPAWLAVRDRLLRATHPLPTS